MRNTAAATATVTATATAPVTIAIAAPAMGTRMYIHRDKKTVGAAATSPPTAGGGTCLFSFPAGPLQKVNQRISQTQGTSN